MILTGSAIGKAVRAGEIIIHPFNADNLQPNSYDFHLGDTVKVYRERILDPRKPNPVDTYTIPPEGLTLDPGVLVLGHIAETIGSTVYVPIIKGISSIARLGLFIVITADLVDLGAVGAWTLQLHCVQPVTIYPGMRIGQMTFWKISGEPLLYSGKYQGSTGPEESKSWKDGFFTTRATPSPERAQRPALPEAGG
jgi:dCTP deaminase